MTRVTPGAIGTASPEFSRLVPLVRLGVETLPDGELDRRIVGGVERELIEHVLQECDGTQVTAARRLGINRNTLHKKVLDYQSDDSKSPPPTRDEREG